ncbi:hypothetical protein CDCA_CDCA16G4185 [Cyanidium caldarium]|uniref:Uncharacterized protein n=1 Tax=Cyanidium caldarium TaxID=2771 RepID=A0AAV9J0P6_CYACA|nr:hypothetical protein CDCA_CDCA16G4185 [Cyanidium caldarium]
MFTPQALPTVPRASHRLLRRRWRCQQPPPDERDTPSPAASAARARHSQHGQAQPNECVVARPLQRSDVYLEDQLRSLYDEGPEVPPRIPLTIEAAVLQAQYATVYALSRPQGARRLSVELPMGRTGRHWYTMAPTSEVRKCSADLLAEYLEVFWQFPRANICVAVSPTRSAGGLSPRLYDSPLENFRIGVAGVASEPGGDARVAPELPAAFVADGEGGASDEVVSLLNESLRSSAHHIVRGHRTGEDEGFLDFVSLADAARDVERQVLGVGVRDDADDGVMAPDGRYAVPACRGRRRRLFFRMRNAYLAHLGEDGAERVPAALPRPGENQLLPDLVIVSNAVASRDFEAAARLVDACAARHVPVVLFNAFLDLANEVGSGSRASAAHLAALEASAFVAVARRRLPRPDMSLMEVVESVRSAAVLEAEPCYVCRAYPRVGAALRMLGGHRIGLDLFDDPRPLRAVEGVDDEHADPWHLFAEVSAFEYEYATQLLVPSPLAPAFGVPDVPRILREHCGYTAHRPEAANGNAFLEAIAPLRTPGADEYCKSQREGNCAGWWPCMSPVRSYHHPSRVWSLG